MELYPSSPEQEVMANMEAQIQGLTALVLLLQHDLTGTMAIVNTLLNRAPAQAPPKPPPPTPTPPWGTPAPTRSTPSPPQPAKKSFAAVAAAGPPPPAQWQQVPKKTKTPKKTPVFAAGYTKANREVVVELAPISDTATNDTILLAAN